jgi:hypothetical protein
LPLIVLILALIILYIVEPDKTGSILARSESRILMAYTFAESLVSQMSFSRNERENIPKITKKIVIPRSESVIGIVGINGRESDLIQSNR